MKSNVALMIALLFLASSVLGNLGSELHSKLVAAAPKAQPSIGQFVQYIRTFAFSDRIAIESSEISLHTRVSKCFNLFDGKPITGRRLLPFLNPLFTAHSSAFSTGYIQLIQGVHKTCFTPFKDLPNLKFGTTYHKIHTEKNIAAPGTTYFKSTAIIAKKFGNNIVYRTAYGWTGGNGIQQFTVTTQRECKDYFFFTKCKDVQVNVPRGLSPGEFQLVTEGLENILYTALASKVPAARLLRLSSLGVDEKKGSDAFQSLAGVQKSQLFEAIGSLIEDASPMSQEAKEVLLRGEEVVVDSKGGMKHTVQVTGESGISFGVKIWTNKTK